MICPKCGHWITPPSRTCPNCAWSKAIVPTPTPLQVSPKPAPINRPKSVMPWVGGGVLIVAIVGSTFWRSLQPTSRIAPASTPLPTAPTAVLLPTPMPPAMVAAPPLDPLVGKTPLSRSDVAWANTALPVMLEAVTAMRKYLDSSGKSDSQLRIAQYKASITQCQNKMVLASFPVNFSEADSLFADGLSKTLSGIREVEFYHQFPDTSVGNDSLQSGLIKLKLGSDLFAESIARVKEVLAVSR